MVGVRFTKLKEGKNKDKVMKGSQTTPLTQFTVRYTINYEGCRKLLMWWWTKVWCDFIWFYVLWITHILNIRGDRHSSWKIDRKKGQGSYERWENIPSKSHYLVSSWSESSCFRCLERSFFSIERRTQARAFPTSVLISLMFWMCLHIENTFRVRGGQLCI